MQEVFPRRPGHRDYIALEIVGDNELVINWLNGTAVVDHPVHRSRVMAITNQVATSWKSGILVPRMADVNWYRHVYRELNTQADALANRAMDEGMSSEWSRPHAYLRPHRLRGWFDGGRRHDGLCSCGWLLQASYSSIVDTHWSTVAWACVLLPAGTSTVEAELTGAELLTTAARKNAEGVTAAAHEYDKAHT